MSDSSYELLAALITVVETTAVATIGVVAMPIIAGTAVVGICRQSNFEKEVMRVIGNLLSRYLPYNVVSGDGWIVENPTLLPSYIDYVPSYVPSPSPPYTPPLPVSRNSSIFMHLSRLCLLCAIILLMVLLVTGNWIAAITSLLGFLASFICELLRRINV